VPVITNILERRKGAWVELFADNRESVRLPVEFAGGIGQGTAVEDTRWEQLKREGDYHVLFDKALRLLGMREHFTFELRRKLAQRTLDKPLITRVIDAVRERGYLDDARACDYLVTQLATRGGVGKLKLKAMLFERGCPENLLQAALEKFAEQYDESEAARELLANKRAMFAHRLQRIREKLEHRDDVSPRKFKMLARVKLGMVVSGYMYARGFSGEEVNRAGRKLVDELINEMEEEEEE
jgi:SOS response regulatory protein OraA/RecX